MQSSTSFLPTVPTFAVRETDVSRTANVGTVGKSGLNFFFFTGSARSEDVEQNVLEVHFILAVPDGGHLAEATVQVAETDNKMFHK